MINLKKSVMGAFLCVVALGGEKAQSTTIEYRVATFQDVDAISEIYDTMSLEDKDHLIVTPKKFRKCFLQEAIKHQRLFIAVDVARNNRIIAFVKIYLVEDQEAQTIFEKELRFVGNERRSVELSNFLICPSRVTIEGLQQHYKMGQFVQIFSDSQTRTGFDESFALTGQQIIFYLGSSYVDPEYRGNKIGLKLDEYAFDRQLSYVANLLKSPQYNQIALMCGQVKGNINLLPVWSFLLFLLKLRLELGAVTGINDGDIHVNLRQSKTWKPDLSVDNEGNLVQVNGKEGYGFFISSEIVKPSY